jgi:uncharacterized membrane protein YfbV (UPF0208 family)
MKTKKATAFWVTFIVLFILYVFTLVMNTTVAQEVCPMIVGALAFSGLGYQGINVADSYQKAKHYRPEMDK